MVLDEDLTKTCNCLEIIKVTGGKIGICHSSNGEKYLCAGTVLEQRGQWKDIYALYLNAGAVQQCAEERKEYRS